MKKILNFLMVMLLVMGLGMASVMTAFQAEAAETAETAGETVSAAETVLTANQDGEAAADASMSASGIYDEADLLSADEPWKYQVNICSHKLHWPEHKERYSLHRIHQRYLRCIIWKRRSSWLFLQDRLILRPDQH